MRVKTSTADSTGAAAKVFDFDEIIDRHQSYSTKWRTYGEDVLPMWVADMDFRSPPAVIRALRERVEHGIFGYERTPLDLREIIAQRLHRHFHWQVDPDAIVFLPGVIEGFNLAIRAFVAPHEGVLTQTPVYMHILHAAEDTNVVSQSMELTREPSGAYAVDFDRFAQTIAPNTRMFLLCNPHNPVGRVFTRQELTEMAELCLREDLIICSDEIHCDITYRGHPHTPIAAIDPEIAARTITLMAPSKTFNIPGLHCAFAVIPNPSLRSQYRQARGHLVGTPNLMGYIAARAAYLEGDSWLAALLEYLEANRDFLVDYLAAHMPQLHVRAPEGTYLAWIDCRDAQIPDSPHTFFLEHGLVAFNDGAAFGPGGEGFVRVNFACPRRILQEGLQRMQSALDTLG